LYVITAELPGHSRHERPRELGNIYVRGVPRVEASFGRAS
jgi:hypothetical protein